MNIEETQIKGLYSIELTPFRDERGFFVRHFCANEFNQIDKNFKIEQINHSMTQTKGTIRGMHFQYSPHAETKVVRCLKGSIFDVAVDIRHNSPTFLQWYGEVLSEENMKMLFIPKGFAHGFQALEDNSEIMYLVDEFYSKESESGIKYNDPRIGIKWKMENIFTSEKDKQIEALNDSFTGVKL